MANWFECKIRYDKTMENGASKKVTEPYLLDALSFTEAEARIVENIRPYISGEFSVSAVKRTKIDEIFFFEGGDRWYLAKVGYVQIDPKTAVEKRSASLKLVQASTFKEAFDNLVKEMSTTLADYEIMSITETPLMDVFQYFEKTDDAQ